MQKYFLRLAVLIVAVALAACGTASKNAEGLAGTPSTGVDESQLAGLQSADLQWTEAKARKARVSQITYNLDVDLRAGGSKEKEARYSGNLDLRFNLKNAAEDLRLDFFEGEVASIKVNGEPVSLMQKKKYIIILPASTLKEGVNAVEIAYSQDFSRTGEGLHRFVDPVDGRVYLHTQFEAYEANRFMPCFDQPDLRAVLNLKVLAPKDWTVVSSGRETSVKKEGDHRAWVFEPSAEISTYLFSLHAGPYAIYKDSYVGKGLKSVKGRSALPLRLFVRQSLKSYLKTKEWFRTTKDGIAYFENYFQTPYPFTKLDQLIVPEFNSGGMENVGAITYTEWILPRSATTRKMRRGLSSLVLHEIAHMWFGDLVTMAWWNDLWLNESFATYMSTIAQAEATEFKEAWQAFASGTKSRAYVEDAMGTTHPIEATINRVKEARTNFDGITYNKGASVLKQLNYYMTSKDFRSGVRDYFKEYAFQNTTLDQFIGSLQKHTEKDLSLWADRWLRQSGTDQVAANWTCEGGRLNSIEVNLVTTNGRKARPQSLEIGLYKKGTAPKSKIVVQNQIRADFDASSNSQIVTLKGDWQCPDFVYPNQDDHGYVLVNLDAKSLSFLSDNLANVDDTTTRTLVWNDLWRMVRETEISLKTYVDVVSKNFPAEKNEIILQQVVGTVSRWDGSILSYWPTTSESQVERTKFLAAMEKDFLKRLKASPSGSDEEKFWYESYGRIAETPTAVDQFYKWYVAGKVSKRFPIDLDRAWGIVGLMSRFGHPMAAKALSQMKTKDATDRGLNAALSAEAVVPKLETKRRWVDEFVQSSAPGTSETRSLQEARSVLGSLFPIEQRSLRLEFAKDYYTYLAKNRASEEQSRVGTVLGSLVPLDCEQQQSQMLKENVNRYSDINPGFKKRFLMSLEEDERCQRIRSRSSL